jgi:hypothetical protein
MIDDNYDMQAALTEVRADEAFWNFGEELATELNLTQDQLRRGMIKALCARYASQDGLMKTVKDVSDKHFVDEDEDEEAYENS